MNEISSEMAEQEESLILRIREGDPTAFNKLVHLYQEPVYNLCLRMIGNPEDAEEVAQDVFIKTHQAADHYEPRGKDFTFLYRIAVNLSLNRIRDRKRKRLLPWNRMSIQEQSSDSDDPQRIMERKELGQRVRRAVERLPENQKTAVILQRFEGLSYEEIADIMQCSVSAVEARLHRARHNLIKMLEHVNPC